jgi:nucleoid associated protein NdpA
MTGIDSVVLKKVIVHKVGNPTRGEEIILADKLLEIEDEIDERLLIKYFLGGFNENEFYHFTHLDQVSLNEVYTWVTNMFHEPDSFIEQSTHIASFLHNKSTREG